KRRQTAMRVRDQPDPDARAGKGSQDLGHLIVELEVLTCRPLRVDLAGARLERGAAAAHLLDDVPRVVDEVAGVVRRVVRSIEQGRRARDGMVELSGIDLHPVPGTECTVSLATEHRTGIDQREVDVEENRSD